MSQPGNTEMVIEFYRQLELLVKARIPLPQAVSGVAEGTPSTKFQLILADVRDALENGNTLEDALARHPDVFDEAHRRLIGSGEKNGLLPTVLHDVTQLAEQHRNLSLDVREIAAYPVLTMTVAFAIVLVMLRYYVPGFGESLQELVEAPLPFYSTCVLRAAHLVTQWWWPIAFTGTGFICFSIWLFSDTLSAQHVVWRFIKRIPIGRPLVDALDMAGMCGAWSLLAKRGEPLPSVLNISAEMVANPSLSSQLKKWQEKCEEGKPIAECIDGTENSSFSLLGTVLQTTPVNDLPEELEGMGKHYAEEAKHAAQRFKTWWQILAFGVMAVTVGFCVISLFVPLIQLYYQVGATTY